MDSDPALLWVNRRGRAHGRRMMLTELPIREFTDATFSSLRKLGTPILKLALAPSLLAFAVITIVMDFLMPSILYATPGHEAATVEVVVIVAAILFLASPLVKVALAMITCEASYMVSEQMLGNVPKLSGAVAAMKKNLGNVVGTALMSMFRQMVWGLGVAILVPTMFFATASALGESDSVLPMVIAIVAGIAAFFLGVARWLVLANVQALSTVICAVEGVDPKTGIERSKALMGANISFFTVVRTANQVGLSMLDSLRKVILLASLFIFTVGYVTVGLAMSLFEEQLRELPDIISRTLIGLPLYVAFLLSSLIWSVGLTIIYVQLRIKREGYDIEVLAQDAKQSHGQVHYQL